jgi:hypothetical protein
MPIMKSAMPTGDIINPALVTQSDVLKPPILPRSGHIGTENFPKIKPADG